MFLISKAGTHGINLVSCRRIVVLEEFFNPVYNLQVPALLLTARAAWLLGRASVGVGLWSVCWPWLIAPAVCCRDCTVEGCLLALDSTLPAPTILLHCPTPHPDPQAIARLFRYGQTQETFVYRMYHNGSIHVGCG